MIHDTGNHLEFPNPAYSMIGKSKSSELWFSKYRATKPEFMFWFAIIKDSTVKSFFLYNLPDNLFDWEVTFQSSLEARILAMSKNRTDTRIYVRGDKAIDYGRVMEVMGLLSRAGFTKVALISGPALSKSKK